MLNYLHAELYKVLHRRYFYLFTGVLLLLAALYCLLWVGLASFADIVALLAASLVTGLFLTPLLADLVFSDQYRQHTLKNELSFGLSRTQIYLGKLCAALLVALGVCALVFGLYLGVGYLLGAHPDAEEERTALAVLWYAVLAALPLWLGMLGISVMVFFLLPNGTAAGAVLLTGLFLADLFVGVLTAFTSPQINALGGFLQGLLLTGPFGQLRGALTARLMARSWLLGLGWFFGSTAVGLALFWRREIS